jgi:hypothetical protein
MLVAAGLAAALTGAPAAAETTFAAGFAGAYARAVLLDGEDAVQGCLARSTLDESRAVTIERRRDRPPTLAISSDMFFDVAEIPGQLVVGERRFPTVGGHQGRSYVMTLDGEATDALMTGRPAAIDYDGVIIRLPRDGLAAAVAFAARCRFG